MRAAALQLCEAEWTRLTNNPDPLRWAATAEQWERVGVPYSTAYARMRESEGRLALKESRKAVAPILAGAHASAQELGAAPLAAAIVDLATRSRISLDVVPPEGERTSGDGLPEGAKALGLTARESEVLTLVAAGHTNRHIAETLFISEKTASVHMTNILAKLGVTSRFDAAAIAKRAGLAGSSREPLDTRPGGRTERAMRTFLLADIASSDRLIESIGADGWNDLRRWHDETLRSQFAKFGSEEIDSIGDGLLAAFRDSRVAIECAATIQRGLEAHRRAHGFAPSVRIAIHDAEATRVGGSYVGRGIHETVRIASLAEGGVILADVDSVPPTMQHLADAPRTVRLKGLPDQVRLVRIDWHKAPARAISQ
jgi:DNA-binding CsgD family transcriptional regulator